MERDRSILGAGTFLISLASKSCNEFFTVIIPTVFKLFRHSLNASSNFASVTFFTVFEMCRHRLNQVSAGRNFVTAMFLVRSNYLQTKFEFISPLKTF